MTETESLLDRIAHLGERHFTEPEPIACKWCGSKDVMKYGIREGVQEYICQKCKRKFNRKDAPYRMRTTVDQVGASLNMYYTGSSLTDIARYLNETHNNPVDRTTIYHWLIKFTTRAIAIFEPFKPQVSGIWIADETALKFMNKLWWIWDVIDRDTRFLLASYLSPNRGTREAKILMELAYKRTGKIPDRIITDKLKAYLDGIELTFGADTNHIQSNPFALEDDTNLIERYQGTMKERTKVIWGFKSLDTARLIIDGFVIHYNFFRPHMSLGNKTPAEVAKIKAPAKNWTELVRSLRLVEYT